MRVTIDIPDAILPETADPSKGVYEAVALRAYTQRRISEGKLATLLNLSRWETEQLLTERGIARPYKVGDVKEEIGVLQRIP